MSKPDRKLPAKPVKPTRRGSSTTGERDFDAAYQKWINQQMEKRVLEYSDVADVSICCATWNVNTRSLSEDTGLKSWLFHQLYACADIYAISLQEIVDLNVRNVVLNSKGSDDMAQYWQKAVHAAILDSGMDYRLVFERHMVGLQLMVLVRAEHMAAITDIRSSVVYTGSYGVTGNKGGIAMRMDFNDSPICFVGAHFHANRENVATRNLDFQTIVEQAVFPPTAKPSSNGVNEILDARPYSASFKAMKGNIAWTLLQHEYVFWFGDLNYRICQDLDDEQVFSTVLQGNWPMLRSQDQLNQERESGNVFNQFSEGIINFPPTYKYQPGTDLYEQRPNKKLRAPAWCDRILWRCAGAREDVRLNSYDAVRLTISDHKPVVAWFSCSVKAFIPERVRAIYQELLFAVDKWVNASTPKMTVDGRMIDFASILINQKYFSTLTLRNTGNVMAEWAFVPQDGALVVSKPWLRFEPADGILAPGETSTVKVVLHCTAEMTLALTEKDLKGLEDIAILRLAKGSDFFVVVSAKLDVNHVEEARKSVRSVVIANPIKPAGKASAFIADDLTAAERHSGRYPRTDVRNTSSLSRTDPAAVALAGGTVTGLRDSEDEEDDEEIALEDIYAKVP